MEKFETQLHDVKKLAPFTLKLKTSRLEELEEFFKMTEREKDFDIERELENHSKREGGHQRSEREGCHSVREGDQSVRVGDHQRCVNQNCDQERSDHQCNEYYSELVVNHQESDDDFFADYE